MDLENYKIENLANEFREYFKIHIRSMSLSDINSFVDDLGGSIVRERIFSTTVSRCGKGFIINLSKDYDYRKEFAEGISILFLGMMFLDSEKYQSLPNMKEYDMCSFKHFETLRKFRDELFLPKTELRSAVQKFLDPEGMFDIANVANYLHESRGYVESRLVELGMIKPWFDR